MSTSLKIITYFYSDSHGRLAKANADSYKKYLATKALAQRVMKDAKSTLVGTADVAYDLNQAIRSYRSRHFKGRMVKEYTLTFKYNGEDYTARGTTANIAKQNKRQVIQSIRHDFRTPRVRLREHPTRNYGYVRRSLVGGVHIEPGFYSTLYTRRLSRLVYEPKHPKTTEHHVGIELEFTALANRDTLGAALFNAGLAQFVTLKGDGSIRIEKANHYAHELAICVPQSKVEEVVAVVTKVLAAHSASVNKSTGMHTHIDVRNRDRSKVFSRLVAAQGILYAMQPKSRRDNNYCKRTKSRDLNTARNAGRYQGVNPEAASKYNTIEVRLHSGTVSFDKIVNWVKLLIAIVDGDYIEPTRAPRKLDTFCEAYKIGNELRSYIKSRMDKFGSAESIEETESA